MNGNRKLNTMKKVLAVIAAFNGDSWLEKCLESILQSSFVPEIMVIDNGSTDDTVALVKKFPSVLTVENGENTGFGRACNTGMKYALEHSYDYVFLLNQDTTVHPCMFETMLDIHKQHGEFGILSPMHLTGSGDRLDRNFYGYLVSGSPEYVQDTILHHPQKPVYPVHFVNAAFWLISRECIEKTGGFDPVFFHRGEDNDYINRARFHGFGVGICPAAAGRHFRENRPTESTYGDLLAIRHIRLLEELKNPFNRHSAVFLSSLYRLFLNTFINIFQLQFLWCLFNWNLMFLLIKSFHATGRSRKREMRESTPWLKDIPGSVRGKRV
jgi:GT2 family glycosyltransferase